MKNVAVIGANGFLGRNIAKAHLLQKDSVWAVYHRSVEKIPAGAILVQEEALDTIKNIELDFIYIAIGSFALSQEEFIGQNIFIHSLLGKLRFQKVIFVSSIAVYGNQEAIISQKSPFNNPGNYGLAKLMGEFIVSKHAHYGIIRFTYLYGPGMSTNSLMPAWIKNAILKKEIKIFGTGKRVQDYLFIDDAVSLCLAVADSTENLVLIGATGNSVANIELAENIQELVPGTQLILTGEDVSPSFRFEIEHTIEKTRWKPLVSVKRGLRDLISQSHADSDLQ
jgi:nucleoside-diphosphate-sugar epimerase